MEPRSGTSNVADNIIRLVMPNRVARIEPVSDRMIGRLRSLDVMRGGVVAVMIVVNFCMVGAGFRELAI
jgi:hypothetical protein